jgi:RNA polymerase sigma-B factor
MARTTPTVELATDTVGDQQTLSDETPSGGMPDDAARALAQVAHLAPDAPARRAVRDRVIFDHLPQARRLASRFAHRGQPMEDLVQVATLGLIHAADRFDATHGVSFGGFAGPTILGELRHYFRDCTWDIRVNRRQQELYLRVRQVGEELVQRLGRRPTEAEIAGQIGVSTRDVREARAVSSAYHSQSLNVPVTADGDSAELGDLIGGNDQDIDSFADRHTMLQLVAGLSEADRRLLSLRFSDNLTQSQIAKRLGISQMQVSRLLSGVLRRLRTALLAEPEA